MQTKKLPLSSGGTGAHTGTRRAGLKGTEETGLSQGEAHHDGGLGPHQEVDVALLQLLVDFLEDAGADRHRPEGGLEHSLPVDLQGEK